MPLRPLNVRADDALHELVDRAVEQAQVNKSEWLRYVIERAALKEIATHDRVSGVRQVGVSGVGTRQPLLSETACRHPLSARRSNDSGVWCLDCQSVLRRKSPRRV